MLNMNDVHWLAGLMEGEGSFGVRAGTVPLIQLGMTDRDVVERARDIMCPQSKVYSYAGKEHRPGWSPTRKPLFSAQVTGVRAAGWMMTLFPLLGERRRTAIRSALAAWKSRPPAAAVRTVCKRGHPYNEANTIITNGGKGRWCRQCQRLHCTNRRASMPEAARQKYLKQSREWNRAKRAAFIGPKRPPGRRKYQEA